MVKVFWTDLAIQDLRSIFDYISKDSQGYATEQVERLINRVDQLENFPESGRIVPEFNLDDTRELIEGSYRIVYEVTPSSVRILRIHHSARLLDL